jgi:sugar phosphate isomerase/epimerase
VTPQRIAFSTLAFPSASLADALSLGRSWGYSGVELRLIDGELIDPLMSVGDRVRVRRTLAGGGLPVAALDSSIRLTAQDGDGPLPELRRFLELASEWEAPLVRVFGGELPAAEEDDGAARRRRLAAAAAVLEAAAPVAERLGVAIGVETHDAFAASAVVAELLAMIGSAAVGAVWDSHHPHRMGESPAEVAGNLASRIFLAQVKDARRAPERPEGWRLVLLGAGEVPVAEMLALLDAAGFRGWVSVEWEKRWHPEIEEPEIALPQHLAVLRQWMGVTGD